MLAAVGDSGCSAGEANQTSISFTLGTRASTTTRSLTRSPEEGAAVLSRPSRGRGSLDGCRRPGRRRRGLVRGDVLLWAQGLVQRVVLLLPVAPRPQAEQRVAQARIDLVQLRFSGGIHRYDEFKSDARLPPQTRYVSQVLCRVYRDLSPSQLRDGAVPLLYGSTVVACREATHGDLAQNVIFETWHMFIELLVIIDWFAKYYES